MQRPHRWIVRLVLAGASSAACSRRPPPPAPAPPPPAQTAAVAAVTATAPIATTTRHDPSPAPAPIAVRGYPHPIRNGMNDPARRVGWSKDGSLFGYCAELGGRDPASTVCELLDAAGEVTKMTSDTNGAFDPKKKREIDAWLAHNDVPAIAWTGDPSETKPAPLRGTWRYPDITLVVERPEAPEGKAAVVRVGGSVGSSPPVFPITLASTTARPEAPPHFAAMNAMAISPDGAELGMVAHFFACEYCDTFTVRRIPLADLARRIYEADDARRRDGGG